MTSHRIKLVPFKRFNGTRLNNYLKVAKEHFGINEELHNYILENHVFVNGTLVNDENYYLQPGDYIEIESETLPHITPPKLEIIHQDDNIIVVNKESGVHSVDAIHPAPWPVEENIRWTTTPTKSFEPFVAAIHRLDVDTSGVLVLALKREAASILGKAIQNRETAKTYYALVSPQPKADKFEIDLPIGYDTNRPGFWAVNGKKAKEAHSRFEVEERFDNNTALVKCWTNTPTSRTPLFMRLPHRW
jgi:23S rRNA-/tRNA-specific pseudouridylate synthase